MNTNLHDKIMDRFVINFTNANYKINTETLHIISLLVFAIIDCVQEATND